MENQKSANWRLRLKEAQKRGDLIRGIFTWENDNHRDEEFAKLCADLHNEGEIDILSIVREENFNNIEPGLFFFGQAIYCKIIPLLNVSPNELMRVTEFLAKKGGDDLASNQPYAAFQEWIRADASRAQEVLRLTKASDSPAKNFLTLALIEVGHHDEAISIGRIDHGNYKVSAIVALGKMKYYNDDDALQALNFLREVALEPSSDFVSANILDSTLAILASSEGVSSNVFIEIADTIYGKAGPQTQYTAATSIWAYRSVIDENILDKLFRFFDNFNPEHKGICKELDHGLRVLLDTPLRGRVIAFLEDQSLKTNGVPLAELSGVGRKLTESTDQAYFDLLIKWIIIGNSNLCEFLFNQMNTTKAENSLNNVCVSGNIIKNIDISIICKRVIGNFFIHSVITGKILVGILRGCSEKQGRVVSELLFDPMLINYGGKLREYLGKIPADDRAYKGTRRALKAYKAYWNEVQRAGFIKELWPSELNRQVKREKMQEQARVIYRGAEKKSVFMGLFHRSTLLHGHRSLTYITDPNGESRTIDMKLREHSVLFEMPRMQVIDPCGLEYMLRVFRFKGIKNENDDS